MAQVINTNSLSLLTQNNLNKSQSSLSSAIERLSSGLRINSAKDDSAGQAIANRFTANIKGLTQASRNANDGISVAQTTEGSLSEINNNLQRVRELSVQATSGINSDSDLKSIQAEIKQRLDEIDRVSGQTQFNGVKVLASDQTMKIQVGANDGESIEINLREITSKTLGLDKLDITNQVSSKDLKETTAVTPKTDAVAAVAAKKVNLEFPPKATQGELVVLDGATPAAHIGKLAVKVGTDFYAATYDSATNKVTFNTSSGAITDAASSGDANATFVNDGSIVELKDIKSTASQENTAPAATFNVHRRDADGELVVKNGTDSWTIDGVDNKIDLATGAVTLKQKDAIEVNVSTGFTAVSNKNALDLPGTAAVVAKPPVAANMTKVNDTLAGTNELLSRQVKDDSGKTTTQFFIKNTDENNNVTYYNATADKDTGKVEVGTKAEVDPLSSIDKALQQVDSLRSDLGAVQNRFDSTITNLGNTINNLSSARSRIEDADYATEVSNMSRAQILQQAGTSVLAQANQTTQNVLSLLR
ncbi:flagellin FliC (plasmid) [Citrobacter freundii]|nr:flagellin [Citrobacter freundii]QMR48057.1 flagellin FliC [Citrobacter freundii]